ncbi:MAG: hypothetical protein LUC93_10730 [Planctomycetaceae bacterium]|nr:hypothetical protein [Planctomycetaceae bacterium]
MKKILWALAFAVAIGIAVPSAAYARETSLKPDAGITEHGPRRHRGPRRGGPHWGGSYGPRYHRPGYRYYAPPRRNVYVVPARPVVVYPSPYYGGTVVCR